MHTLLAQSLDARDCRKTILALKRQEMSLASFVAAGRYVCTNIDDLASKNTFSPAIDHTVLKEYL